MHPFNCAVNCWTWSMRRFILNFWSVSCPETGDLSLDILKDVQLKWSLIGQIQFVPSDRALHAVFDVTQARDHFRNDFVQDQEDNVCILIRCIAHVLHWAVTEWIRKVNDQISFTRPMDRAIRSSFTQRDMCFQIYKLGNICVEISCLDLIAQWHSTFRMIYQTYVARDVFRVILPKILDVKNCNKWWGGRDSSKLHSFQQ